MPKLYFCRSDNQSQGMLRAVLPRDECIRVLDLDSETGRAWNAQNGQPVVTIETVACKS